MTPPKKGSMGDLVANLAAGTLTGMTTSSFSHPMDTLKSRWQVACRTTTRQTCFGFARTLLLQEGLWMGLWKPGLAANVASMGCCVGMRNGLYTVFRDGIGHFEDRASGIPPSAAGKAGPVAMFTAGLFSGMAGYIITAPLLQVKTRMQAEAGRIGPDGRYVTGLRRGHAPTYRSTFQALHALASARCPHERMRSLWRGAGVIVARGAALSGSQLMAYDAFKTMMKAYSLMEDGPLLHVSASLVAAVICTTCHMPFDVVLVVYQSAQSLGCDRLRYIRSGPLACANALLRESGPQVFFRGWTPAFVRLAPVCVFSFWLYEQLRRLVGIGYLD
ncbi:ucpC [Symbiodinium sp. CCMP2592]|nr:ucpC [Symbiodinium sp. CCMP2592]